MNFQQKNKECSVNVDKKKEYIGYCCESDMTFLKWGVISNYVNTIPNFFLFRRDRRLFPREPLSTLSCDHLENRRGLHYIPPNTPDTFPSTELNPENRLAVQPIPGYLPNLTISNPDEINTPIYEPPPGYTTLEKDLVEENPPSYESLYPSQTEVSSDSLDSSQTGVPSYSLGSYQTGAPTGTLYPSQTVPSESHYSSQPGASPV